MAVCKNSAYNKLTKLPCDSVSNEEISGNNAVDGELNDLEVIEVLADENSLFLPVDKDWQKIKFHKINVSIVQLNTMSDSSISNDHSIPVFAVLMKMETAFIAAYSIF